MEKGLLEEAKALYDEGIRDTQAVKRSAIKSCSPILTVAVR